MKAFDNLGLCYEALNQPEQAIAAYRKAIALNRASTEPSFWPPLNLGTLLRTPRRACRGGNPVARGGEVTIASAAKAYYQLGVLLEQQDHPNEAVAALKHAAASRRLLRRSALRARAHLPSPGKDRSGDAGDGHVPAPARREARSDASGSWRQ